MARVAGLWTHARGPHFVPGHRREQLAARPAIRSSEYDVWLFSKGKLNVELQLAPSLDFQSGDGLRLAVSFDDEPPRVMPLATMAKMEDWDRAVSDGVRRLTSTHTIATPGKHVLKIWRVTPGVVLERIVIDAGGVRPSYLGPPESVRQTRSDRPGT